LGVNFFNVRFRRRISTIGHSISEFSRLFFLFFFILSTILILASFHVWLLRKKQRREMRAIAFAILERLWLSRHRIQSRKILRKDCVHILTVLVIQMVPNKVSLFRQKSTAIRFDLETLTLELHGTVSKNYIKDLPFSSQTLATVLTMALC